MGFFLFRLLILSNFIWVCQVHALDLTSSAVWEKAETMKLAQDPMWSKLLHYRKNFFLHKRSDVDSPEFFLSGINGKSDPGKELKATIEAFLMPLSETAGEETKQQHAQCRYPARSAWLKSRLGLDNWGNFEQPCQRFHEWKNRLKADRILIVFASAYLNNPASMFGHTLLRVDANSRSDTPLLQYGVGFAANTADDNSIIFPIKGLTGFYPGVFSLQPYFEKTAEYGSIENRDLWEYELLLSSEERSRFLDHLWEMGQAYFSYYFLDENCSFHILALLEVAKPTLDLTSKTRSWVIPSDVVKILAGSNVGLMGERHYRPSLYSRFRGRWAFLTKEEKALLKQGLRDPEQMLVGLEGVPENSRKSLVLDSWLDGWKYQALDKKKSEMMSSPVYFQVLKARSLLRESEVLSQKEFSTPPEEGHLSAQVTVGGRQSLQKKWGSEVSVRAAYHGLLDRERGFLPHSEIQVMKITAGTEENFRKWSLDEVQPFKLISINPWDFLNHGWSWKVDGSFSRAEPLEKTSLRLEPKVIKLRGGPGMALSLFSEKLVAYSFIESHVEISSRYRWAWIRPGAWASLGFLYGVIDRVRFLSEGASFWDPFYGKTLMFQYSQKMQVSLSKNWELGMGWDYLFHRGSITSARILASF